jgi:hypothetical protein
MAGGKHPRERDKQHGGLDDAFGREVYEWQGDLAHVPQQHTLVEDRGGVGEVVVQIRQGRPGDAFDEKIDHERSREHSQPRTAPEGRREYQRERYGCVCGVALVGAGWDQRQEQAQEAEDTYDRERVTSSVAGPPERSEDPR